MVQLKNRKCRFAAFLAAAFLCVCLCVSLCVSLFCGINSARGYTADAAEAQPLTRTRIVGYLPNWSYQAYKEIDFGALTHINIAFCNMQGNLESGEISSGIPDKDMRDIVAKAHGNNVKIIAALGGGGYGEPYRGFISSSANIASLNEKIVEFCEKYDLDGIDLDIEIGSGDSIWNNYGEWVAALRSICDERDWLLSTATAQWVAGSVTAETFSLFDYLNVMAYDDDSSSRKSHSSYEFAVECLNYFHGVKNVPKDKLALGVPFYGRGYDDNGALDWNSYSSFSDLVKADAANYENDVYLGVAYTGASSMREKCALAKEFGGVMIWEITLDADGEYSLLGLIKGELMPVSDESGSAPELKPDNKNDVGLWIGVGIAALAAVGVCAAVVVVLVKKKNAIN